jgi:hypothetical protein
MTGDVADERLAVADGLDRIFSVHLNVPLSNAR